MELMYIHCTCTTCIYMYAPLCDCSTGNTCTVLDYAQCNRNVVDKLYLFSDGILSVIGLEPLVRLCVILAELLSYIRTDVAKLLLQ